jgi:deoxycytidylate deaminase
MYNIRARIDENNNIIICNSKPCLDCKEAMTKVGINTVVYSNSDGILVKERTVDIDSNLSSGKK